MTTKKKNTYRGITMEEAFVVDRYNPLQNNSNVVETFHLTICGEQIPYCIRRVEIAGYDWGKPQLKPWQEQDWEQDYSSQCAYPTLEAAKGFVRQIRRSNGL